MFFIPYANYACVMIHFRKNHYIVFGLHDLGASAAAPVVAGLVALLRDAFPAASPAALRDALCRTAHALAGPCNRAGSPLTCPFGSGCNYGVGCGLADGWAAYAYLADRE